MTPQQRQRALIGGGLAVVGGLAMIFANLAMPGKFAVIAGAIVVAMALFKKARPQA